MKRWEVNWGFVLALGVVWFFAGFIVLFSVWNEEHPLRHAPWWYSLVWFGPIALAACDLVKADLNAYSLEVETLADKLREIQKDIVDKEWST